MVQRVWGTIDPVFDLNEKSMACNTPGTAASSYIDIKAGDNITALYWFWLHPTGPMSIWLGACGESCEDVDPNDVQFFKVSLSLGGDHTLI